MMFQQYAITRMARVTGGLAALSLLLATSACDQADPLSPASAQSAEVIRGVDADVPAPGTGIEMLGESALNNVTLGTGVTADGLQATAVGYLSSASGKQSTALGYNNVSGGHGSLAAGHSSTALGHFSMAVGSEARVGASGTYSVALGQGNVVSGKNSIALGRNARTTFNGSFIFADASVTTNLDGDAHNQFLVRAGGGVAFYTNGLLNKGVYLTPGGQSWNQASDVAMKENFRDLDGEYVLEKLAGMRIQEWSYITQDAGIRHVGPMAQDFYAAFGLGPSDKSINTIDADGIALFAIQALERRNTELRATVERHEQELDRLNQRLDRLEQALLDR